MKRVVLLFFVLNILLGACKKGGEDPAAETECSIKTLERLDSSGRKYKESYTYDDRGRIIRADDPENALNFATFTYQADNLVIYIEYLSNGQKLTENHTYKMDADGRIIKRPGSIEMADYKYNSDGFLVEIKEKFYSGTSQELIYSSVLSYTNGNLTRLDYTDSLNPSNNKVFKLSYSNELNHNSAIIEVYKENFLHRIDFVLYPLMGKVSKNLVTSISRTQGSSSSYFSYTYQKDTGGKVTTVNELSGTRSELLTFTYSCK